MSYKYHIVVKRLYAERNVLRIHVFKFKKLQKQIVTLIDYVVWSMNLKPNQTIIRTTQF